MIICGMVSIYALVVSFGIVSDMLILSLCVASFGCGDEYGLVASHVVYIAWGLSESGFRMCYCCAYFPICMILLLGAYFRLYLRILVLGVCLVSL